MKGSQLTKITVCTEQTSNYTVHNPGKEWLFTLQPEEHSDFLELTEDNLSQITAVLPELIRQDRERMRREAEKLKKLDELKQGRPEEMTVVILRDVLKEVEVPFKLSDKKDVLVSKLKEARAKDNPSLNCSQDLLSGSSSKKSTQEVSSDQEIIDVNNLKSSPRSPRPSIGYALTMTVMMESTSKQ